MLLRISLILAIIAGLAAGGLNFVMVKDKLQKTYGERDAERTAKETAQHELADTKSALSKTNAILKQTQATLAATTEERDKAVAEADKQSKRAEQLAGDLKRTTDERDNAQAELERFRGTGMNPEQIVAAKTQIKELQDMVDGTQAENKLLGKKVSKLEVELAKYTSPDKPIYLPAELKGKVLAADPKWNFVVLSIGENQGVIQDGQMLVNRDGKLVAKVIVRNVQKDRCIANVMPGWQVGEVIEGDQVIPAYPAS